MKWALSLVVMAACFGQQTVAPTDAPVGKVRGDDWNGYNFENSIETGYRFRVANGDIGKYRSDVNYGNGLRLLSGSLRIFSKEGHGHYFDELSISTTGLGNDPYESASLRVQKNRLYRYDLLWRQNDYFNPALTISFGEHLMNTQQRMQDHDLVLLPDSSVKFFLGFSRNTENGPALTTIQLFDTRGDEFPLFANVRRERTEYRLGNEFRLLGFRVNWMHAWADFKEDTPVSLTAPSAGNNPGDRTTLTSFNRQEPYHGRSPYWRVALFREPGRIFAMNGRFTYTAGDRGFILDESSFGGSRTVSALNRQVLTYGTGRRPVATGNLNLSLFAGPKVTVTNQTSVYNVRTEGDSYYRSVDNNTLTSEFVNFQYLGIRTVSNQTDINVRLAPWFGLFSGYTYSNREISSIQQVTFFGSPDTLAASQTNSLNAGTFGARWKPIKPLTVIVDGEIGRANRPIYPTSEKNYNLFGARVEYQTRKFRVGGYVRTNYNTNSVSLSAYSSRSRNYSAEMSYTPGGRVSFDASYTKLHLDTAGGIAYFANAVLVNGETSYYISNIHHGNATVRFALTPRIDLFAGYSRVQDTGDGRGNLLGAGIGSALPAFQAVQTFPLTFDSPLARLSIRLHERVRWNAGYQFYRYREDLLHLQNYRAHTGYTSVTWSF